MESVLSVLENMGRFLLLIRPADVVDVAIMAFVVYKLLGLMKATRAGNLVKGVGVILGFILEWGVLALVILFQPEIRQLLETLGARNISLLKLLGTERKITEMEQAIEQTVVACTEMSKSRTGVLIVFERKIPLDDLVRSGTTLDAAVSGELLKNIFFVKAPLHDGAVIIRDGRVLGAGCMLPLSRNVNLSRDLGMRHRAGIGVSESSDAVVVIVSEETGSISVALGGMLKRHLKPETLNQLLCNELIPEPEEENEKPRFALMELLRQRRKEEQDGDE